MAGTKFDLLVIGGGIHGANCCLDAASRGLRVALIERDDFGSATSANSAKIAHSGLRYLQHADFKRLRRSVRERHLLIQRAPHLVIPSPFLLPVEGHGIKGRETTQLYIALYDLLSRSRQQFADPDRRIANARMLSPAEGRAICAAIDRPGLSGVAEWPESQVYSTERLLIGVLRAAASLGAQMANRMQADELLVDDGQVRGARVTDRQDGKALAIHADTVIDATGPWAMRWSPQLQTAPAPPASKAMSLLTRSLCESHAISFTIPPMYHDRDAIVDKGASMQFAIPWRGHSLLASLHLPCPDDPGEVSISEEEILRYLDLINQGLPSARLTRGDVKRVLWGIVPADRPGSASPEKHGRIVDHALTGGPRGLYSIIGVKLTTSRALAEEAIDLAMGKAGLPRSRTAEIPIWGGGIDRIADFFRQGRQDLAMLEPGTTDHLLRCYGTGYKAVMAYAEDQAAPEVIEGTQVLAAEVRHAVREEMASSLADVVLRRTDMGSLECPPVEALERTASIMAEELGWSGARAASEVEAVLHGSNYGHSQGALAVST